jgi:hypothetical protein
LQAQLSSENQAIAPDSSPSDQSPETVQALTAKHQAEIIAYQQRIHELETLLSTDSFSPSAPSALPESSTPSNVSGTAAGTAAGVVTGAAAGIAAGIGINDFFANQSEQKESTPELEEVSDNFFAETAPVETAQAETAPFETDEVENPFETINTFPENLTETVADSQPEAIAAQSSFDTVEVESGTIFSELNITELDNLDNPEDFSAVQIPLEEFSPQAEEPQTEETPAADFIRSDSESALTAQPTVEELTVEELIEDPDADPLAAAFWNEPSLTPEELAVENSPSVAELLSQESEIILSSAEDTELFNWQETSGMEAELPNILSETEADSFISLFETDGESNDLAFLELLQTQDEPFALGDDQVTNDSEEAWNIEELLLTNDETPILDDPLVANGQHDDDFDELFDSLFSSEEKERS